VTLAAVAAVVLGLDVARDDDAAATPERLRPVPAGQPVTTGGSVEVIPREISGLTIARSEIAHSRTAYVKVAQPATLAVGETVTVAIEIDAPREVQTVSFSVKLDPNVAQIRALDEGSWTTDTGLPSTFSVELEPDDGGAQVRSTLPRAASVDRRADVAMLQMQAIAPGKSAITLADLHANDSKGRSVPLSLSSTVVTIVRVESMLPGRS
jgi:hypothetical protein